MGIGVPYLSQRPKALWACALISQLQGIPNPDHILSGMNEVVFTQLQSLHGVGHMPSPLITKVVKIHAEEEKRSIKTPRSGWLSNLFLKGSVLCQGPVDPSDRDRLCPSRD